MEKAPSTPRPRWRLVRRAGLSALALVLGFGGGLALLGMTPVLAGICPGCFGFQKVSDRIYIEPDVGEDGSEILRRYLEASQRVESALGPIEKHPRVLVCFTRSCNGLMGGHDTLAIAYGAQLFYLGPDGHDTAIMAHELTHTVLHRRFGARERHKFPAWVDEGIATYVSRDPRFDLNPDTCEPTLLDLPETSKEWRRAAGRHDGKYSDIYYGSAGCAVAKWIKSHPVSALDGLIATQ